MTDAEQREAARQFAGRWKNKGKEDEEGHKYWIDLLSNVLGMENVTERLNFEKKVKVDGSTKRIDVYIPETRVIIEQKSLGKPLDEKYRNSGGMDLTPYQQAKRYDSVLNYDERARWIVTCNFAEIWIYDTKEDQPEPRKISLEELPTKYPLLKFLVKEEVRKISHEMEISIKAGDIVGLLYDAFYEQYHIPDDKNESAEQKAKREHKLKSLNALCVRLVFCLYAEDAGIFGSREMFHDYIEKYEAQECRKNLIALFKVLDTPISERDEYLEEDLAAFPYVNGGLFADEDIEIPQFTDKIRTLLLEKASEDFDWSEISPTIFGAVFESTLNPETRRSGGMHYTSIENIHKVIDPLFLDDLKKEFEKIRSISVTKTKDRKLQEFQDKLAQLTFLDPACGSGNFLTETYLCLRRLENDVFRELYGEQMGFGDKNWNHIKVSISQFYGIEINDFATSVAKTALWIAESQMMKETEDIILMTLEFLPLKSNANIVEENALRIDWETVVPKHKLSYIMGNPPFSGRRYRSVEQNEDVRKYFTYKDIDYVACWYIKAAQFIQNTDILCAFVSTNSICQGEQVTALWKPMFLEYRISINFAYKTFIWDSEASIKAHVHCVIIGFSLYNSNTNYLYNNGKKTKVKQINGYLFEAPVIFIESRSTPLCDVPFMRNGNVPLDGDALKIEPDELSGFTNKKYIKRLIGGRELLYNKKRYVLWLVGVSPTEIKSDSQIIQRVERCRENRLAMKDKGTRKLADMPTMFRDTQNPDNYIALPMVSGERRRYIPMAYYDGDTIPTNQVQIIPEATIYDFGILESNVHMAWMRAVCGRLKSDYRYSKDIVYNNFPWPDPSEKQKEKIEQTAQNILNVRATFPDSCLADLYDPLTMPPELLNAHRANDKAVMAAYEFSTKMSEEDCVVELMKLYQKKVEELQK